MLRPQIGQVTLRLDGVSGLLDEAPQLVPPVANCGGVVDNAVVIDLVGVLVGVLAGVGALRMGLGGVTSAPEEEPGTLAEGDTLVTARGGVDPVSSALIERRSSEPVFFGEAGVEPAIVMFKGKWKYI